MATYRRYVFAALAALVGLIACVVVVLIKMMLLSGFGQGVNHHVAQSPIGSHVRLERAGNIVGLVSDDGFILFPNSKQQQGRSRFDLSVVAIAPAAHSTIVAGDVRALEGPPDPSEPYFLVSVGGTPLPGTRDVQWRKSHDGQTIHVYTFSSFQELEAAWQKLTSEPMPSMENIF